MLISTRVMHYDWSNNIIIPRGFIPGGRDGGGGEHLGGLIYPTLCPGTVTMWLPKPQT